MKARKTDTWKIGKIEKRQDHMAKNMSKTCQKLNINQAAQKTGKRIEKKG
ncbi:MAG: hypothetical protein WC947_08655 [Elusimicrobiota bacterium]